jgi:hypothetical protein
MNERNKFLTDAMAGEGAWDGLLWKNRPDFSDPDRFFKLLAWAQKQNWWPMFASYPNGTAIVASVSAFPDRWAIVTELVDPDRFANAIYEFLKIINQGGFQCKRRKK